MSKCPLKFEKDISNETNANKPICITNADLKWFGMRHRKNRNSCCRILYYLFVNQFVWAVDSLISMRTRQVTHIEDCRVIRKKIWTLSFINIVICNIKNPPRRVSSFHFTMGCALESCQVKAKKNFALGSTEILTFTNSSQNLTWFSRSVAFIPRSIAFKSIYVLHLVSYSA